MGGIGSGRQRYKNRGAVEDHPALDLRILKRLQLLKPGECTYDMLHWRNRGQSVAEARIFVDLEELYSAHVKIQMNVAEVAYSQTINVDAQPCRLGGHRFYFICPVNGSRHQVLYWCNDQFASRQAHGLTYRSQTSTELSRAQQRTAKLHSRLQGNDWMKRPRGRHRYVYARKLKWVKKEHQAITANRIRQHLDLT